MPASLRVARDLNPLHSCQRLLTPHCNAGTSMNISDYDVTELTFEEACAALGGWAKCYWSPETGDWVCFGGDEPQGG